MLRAILLGILVATASAACSKDEGAAPAASVTAAVGKVVAVSGKVEAIRGGATRALAVGAEIFGDDEVVVGADGSVGIDLAHNNARWSLEANRRGKVRESAAWTMAKVDAPAKPVEHATSAAGREGERTAGTSSTTESAAAPAPPPPPAPADEPAAQPAPAPKAPKAEPSRGRNITAKGDSLGIIGTAGGGGMGGGGGGGAAVATGSTITRSPSPSGAPPAADADKATADEKSRKEESVDATDLARQAQLKKTMLAQRATLLRCQGAAGLTVRLDVAQSLARVTIVGGTTANAKATLACMETALRQLKLQQASPVSVTLKL